MVFRCPWVVGSEAGASNRRIIKASGEATRAGMFSVFFSILVVVALVCIFYEIVMRVRLTKKESASDKLAWWGRGGEDVAATYK